MDYRAYRGMLAERVGTEALAFEQAEYDSRCARVRSRMSAGGVDILLITDPADICYLTGYSTFEVSVHTCLVLHADDIVLQVPSIETGPAVCGSNVARVEGYRWEQPSEIVDQLADAIRSLAGMGHVRVGVDSWSPSVRPGVLDGLKQSLPQAEFVDTAELLDSIKIVKSDAELARLRESARITVAGLSAARAIVSEGATDNDVAAAGAQAMLGAGGEFMSMQPIVTAGMRSSIIHTNHKRQRLCAGEPVFLEFGAAYERYTAPMMQTVVIGTLDRRMREVFDTCRRVLDALKASALPGHTFDAAARSAERALELNKDEVFFSGVYGYSVGAQFPPSWVEGTGFIARDVHKAFQPNMVFHLPICLRIPGAWGIGFSETIRVCEDGGEPLWPNESDLSQSG